MPFSVSPRACAVSSLSVLTLGLAAAGCYERNLAASSPCTRANVELHVSANPVDAVDLLLLVDNSNSMAGEQGLLADQLSRMIEVLASGDRDEDGTPDSTPVRSLHVGVVTSDMGGGSPPAGTTVPSCRTGLGDDGILRTAGGGGTGCLASYPPIFEFTAGDDPSAFGDDVACVAVMGTGGCGFEQQLEAVLKAVSPSSATAAYVPEGYVPPIFSGGTFGHGDNTNAGFLRRDSALALMLVTDEEDCSVPDYALFYENFSDEPRNLRCFLHPELLYPIERYVEGFLSLRDDPSLLVYGGIVGIPTEESGRTVVDYDRILAHPDMTEVIDGTGSRLERVCSTADGDGAFPARRMVEVARGLARAGAGTTMQSICAGDFRPAVDAILELIGNALDGACLPRPLNQAADGTVACDVVEILPSPSDTTPITTCAALGELATLVRIETDETTGATHEVCRIAQLTDGARAAGGAGWFYDDSPAVAERCSHYAPGQRISFAGHAPPRGSEVRLECAQRVLRGSADVVVAEIGTFCAPGPETIGVATETNGCPVALVPTGVDTGADDDAAPDALTCDVLTRECAVRCRTTADCIQAGLAASICDLRTMDVVTGGNVPEGVDGMAPYAICVNPVCE